MSARVKLPFTVRGLEAEIVRLAEAQGWETALDKNGDQVIDPTALDDPINLSALASEIMAWIKEQHK